MLYPSQILETSNGLPIDVVGSKRSRRKLAKGDKPFSKPYPYEAYYGEVMEVNNAVGWNVSGANCSYYGSSPSGYQAHTPACPAPISNELAQIKSECLQKFQEAVGEQAQLVSNFVERKQALDLITSKATALLKAIRAIRRIDMPGLVDALGAESTKYQLRLLRKHRRNFPSFSAAEIRRRDAKSMADLWIGWHFGVKPLVADMASAASILMKPPAIDGFRIKGTSKVSFDKTIGYSGAYYSITARHVGTARGQYRGVVRINDPNALLRGQLQLTDIGGVLWEATPWSFVGDWFGNFGQMISSYTNPFEDGYEVIDPVYTLKIQDECTRTYMGRNSEFGPFNLFRGSSKTASLTFSRSLGVILPEFYWKGWSTSLSRALTATSLLVQQGVKPLDKDLGGYRNLSFNQTRHLPKWPSNYDVRHGRFA